MAIKLATAYVEIVPDVRGFQTKLKAALAGRDIKAKVEVVPEVRVRNFQRELKAALAGRDIKAKVQVVPDVRHFQRELKAALAGRDIKAKIDVDAKTVGATANVERFRAVQERKPVNLKVRADTRNARKDVNALSRHIESLARSDVFKLGIGAAAVSSLPAFAAGLAEVAAALQKVSQAALAVPGGIAGAVASVGTLVFGLTGVKDAYDAVTDAADEAAMSSGDQASEARDAASASNRLRNAVVDEAQARKDVARATRDARHALRDLNIEMRGGLISEKRAVLEAKQAREELMRGDFTDIRDQLLRIEEADQRVIETRARNAQTTEELADANAKGVAGSDQVLAANERLIRSQQNVSEAQASIVAESQKTTAAQDKAALAMSRLAPNAREFVQTLRDMVPQMMDLRNLVQDNLFEGLSDQLADLSKKAFPTLEKGLGAISEAWNENFDEMFRVLGTDENITLLDRIFGNTAEAQALLTDTIEPLVEAVATLAAAGSDSLPRLAEALTGAAERFADFITSADSDGRLQRWIDEGITALGDLGETALNVGKMFTAITNAADGNLLSWLRDVTGQWQTFLNSAEGQETLKNLFAEGRDIFNQWKPILEDIPGLFKGIYEGAQTYIGPLLDILNPITSFLSEHPKLVGDAIAVWAGWATATAVINGVTKAINGLTLALGGTAVAGTAGATASKGGGLLAILRGHPILALLGLTGAAIIAGDPDSNPQTQTSGRPGQPQLPGLGTSGQSPTGIPSAAQPGLFTPSSVQDTGGSILPQTQALKDRYTAQGFTDIGGYRPPDGFNEHSSGKAIDVMIPNWQGAGAGTGTGVAMDALRQPNVEYVIWRQQIWYPDGRRKPMEDRGSPTQNHFDHVHIKTFDHGGWWLPDEVGVNQTGKPELVLNPEHIQNLAQMGVDPNTLLHGTGAGVQPGPQMAGVDPAIEQQFGFGSQPGDLNLAGRTEGYIPAGAGFTGTTGGGLAGGLIDLGVSAINNLIDQAAGAGGMAADAFAPGSGIAVKMGAQAAKRAVQLGGDLANIGVGAVTEILTPFGAPRWLSDVDPTSFMPQWGVNPAAVTTGEQIQLGIHQGVAQALGDGVRPPTPPGFNPGQAMAGVNRGVQAFQQHPPVPGQVTGQGAPPAQPPPPPDDPNAWWRNMFGIFDHGGILQPGMGGLNLSQRPEYVFTQSQLDAMTNVAPATGGPVYNIYPRDVDEAVRELRRKERLAAMQHQGRP